MKYSCIMSCVLKEGVGLQMNGSKQRRISRSSRVYVPVAVLLVVAFGLIGISSFLKIISIEVDGVSTHSEEEIIELSGFAKGDNMLWIKRDKAMQNIKEAIPLISEVEIARKFPDTVRIWVKESKPLAWIRFEGAALVIDSEGRILERAEMIRQGLIEVRGFSPNNPVEGNMLRAEAGGSMRLQFLMDVLSAMEEESVADVVSYLDVSSIANISFGYREKYTVLLGGPEGAQHKINQLPGVIARAAVEDPNFDPNAAYLVDMSDSSAWRLRR